MTREEAKNLVANFEYVKAFAEGADIEFRNIHSALGFCMATTPTFENDLFAFRIKPKAKYTEWTRETCPVGEVVRDNNARCRFLITYAGVCVVTIGDIDVSYTTALLDYFMDSDGSPCGTKVE